LHAVVGVARVGVVGDDVGAAVGAARELEAEGLVEVDLFLVGCWSFEGE
jgi:nitrogenase molybdenum-iron protein alpha/beta subunit